MDPFLTPGQALRPVATDVLMDRAWLIAHLDPDGTYSVSVYSEANPTLVKCGGTYATIGSAKGRDFAEARRALLSWALGSVPRQVLGRSDPRLLEALKRSGFK